MDALKVEGMIAFPYWLNLVRLYIALSGGNDKDDEQYNYVELYHKRYDSLSAARQFMQDTYKFSTTQN